MRIPQPTTGAAGRAGEGSFLSEALFSLRYIIARPSLLGLQSVFLIANFACTLSGSVLAPMILGRTGNNELILGSVQSADAVGGVAGGLAMSVWGGPKRAPWHPLSAGWLVAGQAPGRR